MARKPRIHRPSAFYHVILRGNNKQQIFFSPSDKIKFCILLQEGIERFGHAIHGFCLMDNHVHLVMQPNNFSLSEIIHHLAFRYTRYINRKESRVGHLFQGRFRSILVDAENYLSKLIRYIHLNPVRAGLTKLPEDYLWSSHRSYMGLDTTTWLTYKWVLQKFHRYDWPARQLYKEFVYLGMGEKSSDEFYVGNCEGNFLGTQEFAKEMLLECAQTSKEKCTIESLVEAVSQVLGVPLSLLKSAGRGRTAAEGRGVAAYLVRHTHGISLKELATFLSRDDSGLSSLATATERKLATNDALARCVEEIQRKLQVSPTVNPICH